MSPGNKLWIIPGVALGALVLLSAVATRPGPEVVDDPDRARLVEVMPLRARMVAPEARGFGRVAPKHSWEGVAEVTGRLIYRNPQLEVGRLLPEGTLLLKIDPLEYELQLAQASANLAASHARLTRLDQEEVNLKVTLELEAQKLVLVEQEYQRKLTLKNKNLVANSELEAQKQIVLAQQKLLQDLQSALDLLPEDRKVTEAQRNVDQSLVEDVQRKLAKTRLSLPFDARIAEVNVEEDQVVNLGSAMVVAYQLDEVEVRAELSLKEMRTLISSVRTRPLFSDLPSIEALGLEAHIELKAASASFQWPARVTRVAETVNPDQATIGVYLEVAQDYRKLDFRGNPPLTKGMFVEAAIRGVSAEALTVPERAIHGDSIYLMTADGKLRVQPVEVRFRSADGVAIRFPEDTVPPDSEDQVVLNDLVPAIEGMRLKTPGDPGAVP